MIRDTFFDYRRFVNLCRKEMVESWKTNLIRLVLMYGVLAIALVWNAYFEYHHSDKYYIEKGIWSFGTIAFAWGLMVMGMLSASFTMERMKTKTGRMAMLMTPATMFEKFFARWLVFTFGFLMAYIVAYKLADYTRILFFIGAKQGCVAPVPLCSYLVGEGRDSIRHWSLFGSNELFLVSVAGYFFFQSFFVLGSTIWPKNAFSKTFAAGIAIFLVYVLIGSSLGMMLLDDGYIDLDKPSETTLLTWLTLFLGAMSLFNWVLAYFRFKESEIINRW